MAGVLLAMTVCVCREMRRRACWRGKQATRQATDEMHATAFTTSLLLSSLVHSFIFSFPFRSSFHIFLAHAYPAPTLLTFLIIHPRVSGSFFLPQWSHFTRPLFSCSLPFSRLALPTPSTLMISKKVPSKLYDR